MFIDQIQTIVRDNISNEKFGVSDLASQLGLSKSQTLRKVKSATGKSANQFIREFRLEEAAKLIKNTDDTIAEISYKVGFGSPSYFNKAFSKRYGVAPGEYKTQSANSIDFSDDDIENKPQSGNSKRTITYAIAVILIGIVGYFIISNSFSKSTTLTNSIAVLPFKDLSPEDNQWFCDGVSDNILHSLAQMKDLSVTSFTSSSTYRDSDKQIPKIAKELGVSYVLEGSVVLHEGSIKIIAQLIDANDQHVWSKEYNERFENVIDIQKNVAQEVMQQLKITLNTDEEKALQKYPTENMEAYSLHLRGRLINGSRAKNDLELNIEMNKKAIALDSSFSEAYSEVAKSYFLLAHRHFETVDIFECRDNATFYADKALEIDSNNAMGWGIKGSLNFFSHWSQSLVYINKAIALNPNETYFRTHYGIYYKDNPNPDFKKALEQYRIAYELDPLSVVAAANLLGSLIFNNHVKEAEAHYEKVKFLFSESALMLYREELVAHKNKDWTTIIPLCEYRIKKHPNNDLHYERLAVYYQILNDNKQALHYAKRAYELNATENRNVILYVNLMLKGDKFEEANNIMQSNNYKTIVGKRQQLNQLWYYYYLQKNYDAALMVLKDSLFINQYYRHTYTYAQMGNRKKVDSMNKRHPWGTGRMADWRINRAIIHAALKDTDSMYMHLEYVSSLRALIVNGHKEFDPYRKEARFKAFLKKNYLPVHKD